MTIKYSKALGVAGVALISVIMVAPSNAADPVITTGTIHVVSVVINDSTGTKTPADFIFSVKHWGSDAVGSPVAGQGAPGVSFVVEAGTYVVSTPLMDGYTGVWSGVGVVNGFIDLQPGQEITIIRTSEDFGVAGSVVPAPVPAPTTEDGGTLPVTSTPWFNLLGFGMLLSLAGAFGIRRVRISTK